MRFPKLFKNIALAVFLATPFTSGSVLHHGRGDIREMYRRSETLRSTQTSITQNIGTTNLASATHNNAQETSITKLPIASTASKSDSSMPASHSTAVISIPDPVATSDATRM